EAGDYTNTSGALSSSLGVSGTATATLRVNELSNFRKAFSPNPILEGAVSTLTFTVDNTASTASSTQLAFVDTLPAGLVIAEIANGGGTCQSGTLTAISGTSDISYSGGTVGVSSACTITVDVTAATAGDYANTSGALSSSLGESGTATATLRVNALPGFAKSFSPNPAVAGSAISLTFTVDNTGSTTAATALSFTDELPLGLVVAASPNGGDTCVSGTLTAVAGTSTISYTGGTASASSSCAVTVDVFAANAGDYTNTSGALASSLGTSPAATATLRVNGPPAFSKAFSPDPVVVGDGSTLTFTVDNTASTASATELAFADTLPAGLLIAATPNGGGTCLSGTLTAAAGTSAISYSGGTAGAAAACTITVDVTAGSAGDYTNTSGALSSSLGVSGTATATLRVNALPGFAKSFSPNPAVAGSLTALTFTVDNTGSTTAATALSFIDVLPLGLVVAASPNGRATCESGALTAAAGARNIRFSGGTVGAGSVCTVTVDVTAASAGDYTNTSGALTSTLGSSGSAVTTLRVNGAPAFTKTFAPEAIQMGSVSTLRFTIDNSASTEPAESLAFADPFPEGLVVAATPNASSTCSAGTLVAVAGSGSISYSGGSVGQAICVISVDVEVSVGGEIQNVSDELTSSLGSSGTATATLGVAALDFGDAPDPAATIAGSYPTRLSSDGARHVLAPTGGNIFLGTAPDPELDGQPDPTATGDGSDEDGVNFPASTLEAGTLAQLSVTVGDSGGASAAQGLLSAWIDFDQNGNWEASEQVITDISFASAGSFSTSFIVPPSAATGGTFARFRYSTQSGLGPTGLAADGEVEDYLVSVVTRADLSLALTASAETVVAGTALTYTLQVDNAGPANAALTVASLVFGPGLTLTNSDCSLSDPGGEWSIGTLAPGGSIQCLVTMDVSPQATGIASSTASVRSGTSDPDATDDQAALSTPIVTSADLEIVKSGPASATPGDDVEFTLVVRNNGPSVARDLLITDTPSTGLSVSGSIGGCAAGFPCAVLSLAVGAELSTTTTVNVAPGATGVLSNEASIAAATSDPDPSNNTSTAFLSAVPTADLQITKTGPEAIVPGEPLAYLIRVENLGPSDAVDVTLTDPTPAGLVFGSATGVCTSFPCSLGTLSPGDVRDIAVGMSAPATITRASVTNVAEVGSATPDGDASNNIASVTSSVTATADLALTKSADVVVSGTASVNLVAYEITVTNFGPSATDGVTVHDAMPPSLTVVSFVATKGVFDPISGVWDIGTLSAGEGVSVEIVTETLGSGVLVNTAEIMSSSAFDPNSIPGNAAAGENDLEEAEVTLLPTVDPTTVSGAALTDPLGGSVGYFAPGDPGGGAIAVSGTTARISGGADDQVLLYAGSRRSGVFRLRALEGGGRSWEMISPSLGESVLETTALSTDYSTGSPRLVVSFDGLGVFESGDRGLSWTEITGSLDASAIQVLEFGPSGTLYAGTAQDGVLRMSGGGWSSWNDGLTTLNVRDLAHAGGFTYAATWGGGVFRSDGSAWEHVSDGLGVGQVTKLTVVRRGGEDRLIAGTWGGGVSELVGDTWSSVGFGLERAFVLDVIAVGTSPGVIAVTRDATYQYDVGADAWLALDQGLGDERLLSVAVVLDADGTATEMFAGTANDWVISIADANGDQEFFDGRWEPAEESTQELLRVRGITFDATGSLFAAVDGGGVFYRPDDRTPSQLLNSGLTTRGTRTIAALTDGGVDRILVGSDDGVFVLEDDSRDGELGSGDTWFGSAGLSGKLVQALGTGGAGVVAGTSDGVYVSQDRGSSWQFGSLAGTDIRSLASVQGGFSLFAGTVGQGVLRSTDGGYTWTSTGAGVGGPVSGMAAIGTNVFAATPQGVFASGDLGNTWTLMAFEALGVDVISLAALDTGVVYAGTAFEGAFFVSDWDRDGAYADEMWQRVEGFDPEIVVSATATDQATTDVYFGSTSGRIFRASQPTGVAVDGAPEIPEGYALGQNYPNPFNPVTAIPYALPGTSEITIEVFDLVGRSVALLVSGVKEAGYHTALWDASGAPTGVYLYRIQAEGFTAVRRLVLLK
ncbi:MAG: putative repeat protein (TIGR01451 family), partial [Rhodothermales bacterium]